MKIYFERSGGFAGLIMAVDLDLDDLPKDEADKLYELIDEADLHELNEIEAQQGYADGFHYLIKIEQDETDERILEFNEGYIPSDLVPLVNDLCSRARYQRRT